MTKNHNEKVADLLYRVANSEISTEIAFAEWGDVEDESEPTLAHAWHYLTHFANDEDLREDAEYDQLMRNKLREFADEILLLRP